MLSYYRHTLIPPRGYSIAGIFGNSGVYGGWVDALGLIIAR